MLKLSWPWPSLQGHKGHRTVNTILVQDFVSGTPLWSMKEIGIYIEELSCSQAKLTLTYFRRSRRSQKGQYQTRPRFWSQKHLCEVWKWLWYFLRSYRVHKTPWWTDGQTESAHFNVPLQLRWVGDNKQVFYHDTTNRCSDDIPEFLALLRPWVL